MKEKSYELLSKLGYQEKEIENILITYPLTKIKDETLYKNIKNNYTHLIDIGYTKEQVLKMTTLAPLIYSISINNINQKIDDLISLGYTKEQVLKMTTSLPSILGLSVNNLKLKIEDLISLGYTKEQVLKMTNLSPSIYSISINNLKQKIENLISLGYTKEQVLKITTELPSLFGLTIKNIQQKIKFYDSINMHELALLSPKNLMQSTKLSYARYEFFKRRNIDINIDNCNKMFLSKEKFKNKYDIDNKTILEMYPYEDYLKILKFYERLNTLYKLNPNEATKLIENEVQKYLDDNNSVEKRISNNYEKVFTKILGTKPSSNK